MEFLLFGTLWIQIILSLDGIPQIRCIRWYWFFTSRCCCFFSSYHTQSMESCQVDSDAKGSVACESYCNIKCHVGGCFLRGNFFFIQYASREFWSSLVIIPTKKHAKDIFLFANECSRCIFIDNTLAPNEGECYGIIEKHEKRITLTQLSIRLAIMCSSWKK